MARLDPITHLHNKKGVEPPMSLRATSAHPQHKKIDPDPQENIRYERKVAP
ncbi:hypothetical protein D3C77_614550 [compost metagenome]